MFPFSTTEEPPLHCQILLVPEKYHPIPPEKHPIPVTGPLPLPPIPFTRMQGFLQSPLKPHPSIAGSTARDRIPSPSATSPSGSPIYTAANLLPHSPSVPGLVLHLPPPPPLSDTLERAVTLGSDRHGTNPVATIYKTPGLLLDR